jgi:uncharacterized protein YwqG
MPHDAALIRELLEAVGLAAHADAILRLASPSIRLSTRRAHEDSLPLGGSKMGGSPDLPAGLGWDWFRWHGTPLTLMAQFRLSELAAFPAAEALPTTGLLYFFCETYEQRWGFDPDDRGVGRVLYIPDESQPLERVEHPAGKFNGRWVLPRPACSVEFSDEWSLPDFEIAAALLGFSSDEIDAYVEAKDTLYERDEAIATHRLLGHPDQLEGDMRFEVQMASHGLYWGDERDVDDQRVPALSAGVEDWRLLLQVDTDENLDVKWRDNGMIYFWIEKVKLLAHDFDDGWVILQSF